MTRRMLAALAATMLAACGSTGGGGGSTAPVQTGGGKATAGQGGFGGTLRVVSTGGSVTLTPTGALPAPKTWSYAAPDLGTNPRTISGAVTLSSSDVKGDDGVTSATGLHVRPGATLTLVPDLDLDGDAVLDTLQTDLTGGVLIEGTVQLARLGTGPSAAGWSGTVGALAIRPGGRIVATGDAGSATVDGGAGGILSLEVVGRCSVEGLIDARGGRGQAGGAGGIVGLVVQDGDILVSGTSDTSGGEGLAGVGGRAGDNEIWGRWSAFGTGDYWMTGVVLARGGSGTAGGGAGGWAYGSSCRTGEAFVSGRMDTSGGDATVDGPGGHAEQHEVDSDMGRAIIGGRHLARGGRGAGAGVGGDGAWIGFFASMRDSPAGVDNRMVVKAELDVRGGDGTTGGAGGDLELDSNDNPGGTNGVTFIAAALDHTGGQGTTQGGGGGAMTVSSRRGSDTATTSRIGSVRMGIPASLRGGAATAGLGGLGGEVLLQTHQDGTPGSLDVPALDRRLEVTAALDLSGGAGVTGGAGGTLEAFEHVTVDVTAPLLALGGAGTTGTGGAGGAVTLTCDGVVKAGVITVDGGGSTGAAGGQGGTATLTSTAGPSVRRGVVSVRGGAGNPAASPGVVTVDGVAATLTSGQLAP